MAAPINVLAFTDSSPGNECYYLKALKAAYMLPQFPVASLKSVQKLF